MTPTPVRLRITRWWIVEVALASRNECGGGEGAFYYLKKGGPLRVGTG